MAQKMEKTEKPGKAEKSAKYDAESIKVLEGLEGVRRRPAMYIGSTGKDGLHHLIYEAVDNSVDEALAGFCNNIKVTLKKDGSAVIEDDGRGIPIDIHPQYKIPAVQVALTKLHAGGKFDKKSYMISGGLHGVGISCVNALSSKLVIEIKKNGQSYVQEYSRGNAKTKLKEIGKTKGKDDTGTKVTFWPDEQIFSIVKFDPSVLETRLREIAFLNAGLKIVMFDETKVKKYDFHYAGGLSEFVKWANHSKEVLHPKPIYFKREINGTVIEIAIQYNNSYQENIFGFVNTINTVEGGTHVSGFKTALTRVANDYARKKGMLKNGALTGDDVREGLTAIVSIKLPEPQFEGQTKTKLGNSEIKGFVDSIVSTALAEYMEENPTVARRIINKSLDASKARAAAKKAKDLVRRKNAFSIGGLPGKLTDCSSKKKDKTELYLVEGMSAGGSAKDARDKETQAILPLKGKILNVEKASPTRALSSEEVANLITAIGTGVGESFNIEKLRYGKIVIMADADVDGEHIKTLLLTFFFRFMPHLIEEGKIYAAWPPLYKIRKKKDYYAYSEEELKKITESGSSTSSNVTRFKGLGEMNVSQLWDTTMNPKTRKIKKIYIEDAIEADRVFSMLMGDDVQARKEFISENAKEADLDI
jgi:DNA gyrase subunit B